VAWASPRLQAKAFQEAWLALLRTDLPRDMYKKVCCARLWCVCVCVCAVCAVCAGRSMRGCTPPPPHTHTRAHAHASAPTVLYCV
jgi:hypothetical protein